MTIKNMARYDWFALTEEDVLTAVKRVMRLNQKQKEETSMTKPKAKKPAVAKAKMTALAAVTESAIDPKNMQFWRTLSMKLIPDDPDDWHIGEVATALKLQAELLTKNWASASKIGDRSENDTVALACSIKIVRKSTPPTVHVGFNYSEAHRSKAESDVPDPSQTELPGLSEAVAPVPEQLQEPSAMRADNAMEKF